MKLVGISGIQAARSIGDDLGGAGAIVQRLAGLGGDEIDAGIPGWAYLALGLGAGAALAYIFRGKIEEVVGR